MREKELLYLRLFVGTIFILVGFFWFGSEVIQWLKYGHWNVFTPLDVIEIFFPTAVLKLADWLHEPHSWFGLHKSLHGLIEFIYRAFLFIPFPAIVILIGGGLCDGCSNKLGKMKRDKEILKKIERMRRKKAVAEPLDPKEVVSIGELPISAMYGMKALI
jgi:hypothetical protein